jgi:hypothetical protein
MKGKKTILAIATIAAGLTAVPAQASVQPIIPKCRNATVQRQFLARVCYEVDLGDSGSSGLATTPWAYVQVCTDEYATCDYETTLTLRKTGFEGGMVSTLEIDPASASVRWGGGTIGYVYLNGRELAVDAPAFCAGTPAFCGGSPLVIG